MVVVDVRWHLLRLSLGHVGGHCQVAEHLVAGVAHDALLVRVRGKVLMVLTMVHNMVDDVARTTALEISVVGLIFPVRAMIGKRPVLFHPSSPL